MLSGACTAPISRCSPRPTGLGWSAQSAARRRPAGCRISIRPWSTRWPALVAWVGDDALLPHALALAAAGGATIDVDFGKPLPDLWPQFDALAAIALLAIRGANSKLLSTATLQKMQERHPGMESITAKGQGHAPFLETGDLPEKIAAFLDRAENQVKQK